MGVLIRPEWWDWSAFVVIPLALLLGVWAVWLILTGIGGLVRTAAGSHGRQGWQEERERRHRRIAPGASVH